MGDSLVEATQELERAYDELLPLFNNPQMLVWGSQEPPKMPKPVITIQSKKMRVNEKPVYGWYRPAAWHSETVDAVNILAGEKNQLSSDEINITPEGLSRPTNEILLTLLHQMVHHYCQHRGTPSLGPTGWHNYYFKHFAEVVDLTVRRDGSRGWSNTSIDSSSKVISTFSKIALKEEAFDLARKEQVGRLYKGSSLKKWSCECTNLRAATFVEAQCLHCGKEFKYTDKDAEDREDQLNNTADWHKKYNEKCQKYHSSK